MDIRFYLDQSSEPHIHRHQVTHQEVEEVLQRPLEDRSGVEGTRVAIGRTEAGRLIRVIYVLDPDGAGLFVITAYDLGPKARKALRSRLRKR